MAADTQKADFRQNLATPWLVSKFELSSGNLTGSVPNTILGLIKGGTRKINQPLRTVTNVSTETRFHTLKFIIAVLAVLFGLGLLSSDAPISGILLLAVGVFIGLHVYTADFVIRDASGADQRAAVSILEQERARTFADAVNQAAVESTSAMSGTRGDTTSAAAPVGGTLDSVEQIQRLKTLLDDGALTQDEYDEQKRRILG